MLKVAGSGACHSDVALFHDYDADPTGKLTPPYVLGHEVSGWVDEVGPGVTGFEGGSAHLVYGPIGWPRCWLTARRTRASSPSSAPASTGCSTRSRHDAR